jgi:hypothetical protein
MITREELKGNYKNFSDSHLIGLANEPDNLSLEALDILSGELKKREINIEIQPQSPPKSHIPETSVELKTKFPDALQIFSFEQRSIVLASLVFSLMGGLFFYVSIEFMTGYFTLIKYVGLLFIFLAGYVWIDVRVKNAQMVVLKDEILFKQKNFRPSSKLAVIDVIQLLFSDKYIKIKKTEIEKVVRPIKLFTLDVFSFQMVNRDLIEISFHSTKEYFEEVYFYLEEYIRNEDDN